MEKRKKKSAGQSGADNNEFLRNKTVRFLCSTEEHEKIKKLAGESGHTIIAQFAREQALAEPGKQTKATLNALRKCQFELNRIGTNINEIAKVLNYGFEVDRAIYGSIKDIKKLAYQILQEAQKGDWGQK